MNELLERLENETGVPATLLERAAAARAQALGTTPEQVVASWLGEAAPAAAPAAEPAAAEPAPAAPAAAAPAAPPPAEAEGPAVEVLEPVGPPPEAETAAPEPEAPQAAAAGISGFPSWLAAALIVVPLIALTYALITPAGPECGTAGQLRIDPETGEAVNCDGTPYGVEVMNFFTIGQDVYAANCVACHGADGGGGTGPAFAGGAILTVFSPGNCADHVEWVALGTIGWPAVRGDTYGDINKPVGGSGAVMPGFQNSLTEEELAAVSLYERVAFGGQPLAGPDGAEADCGLAPGDVVAQP